MEKHGRIWTDRATLARYEMALTGAKSERRRRGQYGQPLRQIAARIMAEESTPTRPSAPGAYTRAAV